MPYSTPPHDLPSRGYAAMSTKNLACGRYQPKANSSTGFIERAMGIESTSEVWESTKPFVGRSAAFMRPRRRRGSSEKARSRWQFRCIAAPRNHGRLRGNPLSALFIYGYIGWLL